MSNNIVANVKEFIMKLVKDRGFQNLLQNSSTETRAKLLEEAGYNFTKTELESAAIELLEAKEKGQLDELSEDELVAVFGGYSCEWNFEMFAPVSKPSAGCMHGPVVGGAVDISAIDIGGGLEALRDRANL